MKKIIDTTNTGLIAKTRTAKSPRGKRIIVCGLALSQLLLYAAACEELEDYEGSIETVEEAAEAIDIEESKSPCHCGHHGHCGGWPKVKQFVLVDAQTDKQLRVLEDGDVIDLAKEGPGISILAVVSGHVRKVVFSLNDNPRYHTEYYWPHYLAADRGKDVLPWEAVPGEYTLTATPYRHRHWHGSAGQSLTIDFTIVDSGSIEYKDTVFTAAHSLKALDIDESSSAEGAKAVQMEFGNFDSQLWTIRALESGFYEVVNKNSGKCLAPDADAAVELGASLVQTTCVPGDNSQKWDLVSIDGDVYEVINAQSDLCMDIKNQSIVDGAAVIQSDCNDTESQQWKIKGFTP